MSQTRVTTTELDQSYDSYFGLLSQNTGDVSSFATENDFINIHEVKAISWRDVPIQKIFKIMNVRKVQTKSGSEAMILYLYERESEQPLIAWASSLLQSELNSLKEIKDLYVKSTGSKKSLSTGRQYFSYQLVQKQ